MKKFRLANVARKSMIPFLMILGMMVSVFVGSGYAMTASAETGGKTATVYYENSSYQQAYIHYSIGGQAWTAVPGEKMEASSAQDGYAWKYVIDLGSKDSATVCFNNGSGSWDSKNGVNYTINAGTYGIKDGKVEELTDGLDVSLVFNGTRGSSSVGVTVEGGVAPYTYNYVCYRNGEVSEEITNTSDYTTNYATLTTYDGGTYKVDVVVTDAEGKTEKQTITKELPPLYIASIEPSVSSPQKVGTTVTFKADIQSEFYYKFTNYRSWTISKDGVVYKNTYNGSNEITYTFEEAGTYEVTCKVKDATPQEATKTIQFVVSDETNVTTVYYNTSWDKAYIHYSIGGQAWTNTPGVMMTPTTEKSGYNYKAVIDLGESDYARICFNNGSGTWDSKNGVNYTINAGTYGIKDGKVEELTDGLDVSLVFNGTRGSSSVGVTVEGGVAPYTYNYVCYRNGEVSEEITNTSDYTTNYATLTTYDGGTYKVDVVVTDAEGKTGKQTITKELPPLYIASIEPSVSSPQKVGTTVTFKADIQSEFYYKFTNYRSWTISKDGVVYKNTYNGSNEITYTFEEAGTYEVTCKVKDATPQEATKTIQFVVSDKSNVATVYYNTSWDKAYIHYSIGGQAWTAVPGVAMIPTTEKSGYNYKAVIDLGESDYARICFNNGSGTWDSKKGVNYTVNAGTYGVKDETISEIK